MTQLAVTKNFNDWSYSQSGDGSFTRSGEKWLLKSGIGTGSSLLSRKIPARPGETITFRCYGRLWAGAPSTSGGITIEYPAQGDVVASNSFSKQWQLIECSFTVPSHATRLQYVRLAAGLGADKAGGIEVLYPSIEVSGGNTGFARLWACAFIDITSSGGVVSYGDSFARVGVTDLSYDNPSKELRFKIPVSNNSNYLAPIISADMFSSNALNVAPRVLSYSRDTGSVVVTFIDTTTGAVISSTPPILSLAVRAVGI